MRGRPIRYFMKNDAIAAHTSASDESGHGLIPDPETFLAEVERSFTRRIKPEPGEAVKVGLDLGTASIVLVVLGRDNRPLGAARRFAQVVRDGLVVDFGEARSIVEELKADLEKDLGVTLDFAAIAVPSGTSERDAATHRYVAQGAGLEADVVLDEPAAANLVLNIKNGAIADIGGGTTGVAVFEDGRILKTFDEPTGGAHLTLVLAGHYKMSFEEAEVFKQDPKNARKIGALVAPVLQKMGSIIRSAVEGFPVDEVHLVGGTAGAAGIEKIVGQEVGLPVTVSARPILVTPVGIALGCPAKVPELPSD